jgi:imidazolonepropionase-like amidohydrolase
LRSVSHWVKFPFRFILAGMLFGVAGTGQSAPADGPTAFVNVNVVHPELNTVIRGQTIVVAGATIREIGPAAELEPAPGSRIIDVQGAYVLAGLADMHAHVPLRQKEDTYLNDLLFLWVANGVTTIRGMNGEPAHLALRERIARGEILGPRLFTAGPPFIGAKLKDPEVARERVAQQAGAGYDFIKVHMGITRSIYDAVARASRAEQIPFAGHVAQDVGLTRALEAGQATIDHLDGYLPALVRDDADVDGIDYGLLGAPLTPFVDEGKFDVVVQATLEAGVWNVPTLSMAEKFVGPIDVNASRPGLRFMPPRIVKGWIAAAKGFQAASTGEPLTTAKFLDYRLRLVKQMHDAGAGLLLGSDAPQILNVPGFATHNELALLVEAGLTPAQALTTGTVNPARFFGQENTFGRVAVGFDADLILVSGNPLEQLDTLRRPLGVMLRGRWISADEIEAGLAQIAERNAPN